MKKILLPVLFFAALSGTAQKVSGKLSLQKGQVIEVTTNTSMTTQMPMGELPMTMVNTELYTVGESGPAGIQLTKTVKRMKISANMMGQEMNADSDNPKDLEGQFGAPIKEVMKQKQEFTIDAAGNVIAVKSEARKADQAGGMGMMLPGMNAGSGLVTVGQPSFFKVLPAREVAKGDTWTDSTGSEGNITRTTYMVKDITPTEVILDYTGDLNTKSSQNTMGMNADITAKGKVMGTVTVDKASGLLKQKTIASDVEAAVNMAGQELNTTTKMTATSTVKIL